MTAFCINCDCKRPYQVEHRFVRSKGRGGGSLVYKELCAICEHCGEELYVPDINDINAHARSIRMRVMGK